MKKFLTLVALLLPLLVGAQSQYFYTSGFNISGVQKTDYQPEDVIVFNLESSVAARAESANWTFTHSETGAVLATATGSTTSQQFTLAQGMFGIDVKVDVSWGKYTTTYFKRHRVVEKIERARTNSPNFIVDFSAGVADPLIDDLGSSQYALNLATCNCGDVVKVKGSISTIRFQVINGKNCPRTNPLWIVATSAATITKTGTTFDEGLQFRDGISGVVIWGMKDGSGNRYFQLNGGGIATFSSVVANSHNSIEIAGLKISNAQSSGIKIKLDNVDRFVNACSDLRIHDNELNSSTFENAYLGYEASFGYRFDTGFNGGDYHHTMRDLKFYANWSHDAGWDGSQCTGADQNTEVHDNLYENNGKLNQTSQSYSISAAGGFAGQIFNNIFDRQLQVFANGDTYIYNNYIPGHIGTENNGIFVRRYDNPMFVGPNGDSYQHSSSTGKLYVFNNYITSIADPVYILDGNDASSGIVPLAAIYYFNNTITWSGTAQETGGLRYQESGGSPIVVQTPNLITPTRAAIQITNDVTHDLTVSYQSPVFAAANEGTDLTAIITNPTVLRVGLTDLTGQSYPLRGYFRNAPIQRYFGYTEPSALIDQFQWYQTAQTTDASAYSDKVRLSDMYGYKVKTYTLISGSAKPRLVLGYTPVAKTGTLTGTEVMDDVSN